MSNLVTFFQLERIETASRRSAQFAHANWIATEKLLAEQRAEVMAAHDRQNWLSASKENLHNVKQSLEELHSQREFISPASTCMEVHNHLLQLRFLGISKQAFDDFSDKDYYVSVEKQAQDLINWCSSQLPADSVDSLEYLNRLEQAILYLRMYSGWAELYPKIPEDYAKTGSTSGKESSLGAPCFVILLCISILLIGATEAVPFWLSVLVVPVIVWISLSVSMNSDARESQRRSESGKKVSKIYDEAKERGLIYDSSKTVFQLASSAVSDMPDWAAKFGFPPKKDPEALKRQIERLNSELEELRARFF